MPYVIRTGSTYRIVSDQDIEVCDGLPPLNYTVKQHPVSKDFYLEPVDAFVMPKKLYGDTYAKAKRVLNTFRERPLTTGVHLDGVKGSGKTLLAKVVSHLASKDGIPSIIINQPFHGDEFNSFIQSIDIPAVIIFDEFEKVYSWDSQNKILTLFDGVYPTKKLFIITTNDAQSVNNFLKNRPGRIYYSFKFDTLSQEFIEEYCNDNLKDKSQIDSILKYTKVFSFFNFDMLSAAVEEMNRYNESLQDVLNYLNIVPENKSSEIHIVKFIAEGITKVLDKNLRGFTPNDFTYYLYPEESLEEMKGSKTYNHMLKHMMDEDDEECVTFSTNDLTGFDPLTNVFTFSKEKGGVEIRIVVERVSTTPKYGNLEMLF